MSSPPNEPPPQPILPAAGWYTAPDGQGQRWWDGTQWGPPAPPPPAATPLAQPSYVLPPQEKSSGIATVLTILWPGAGHLYLGLTRKGTPFVVANAIGVVIGLILFILIPATLVIWLVTLCMTIGSVTQDTNLVNDALRRGQRIDG